MSESIRHNNIDTRQIIVRKVKGVSTVGTLYYTDNTVTNLVVSGVTSGFLNSVNLTATNSTFTNILVTNTTATNFKSTNSTIANLTLTTSLNTSDATITNLNSTNATFSQISATSSTIGTLNLSNPINVTNITASNLFVNSATMTNLNSSNSTLANLNCTHITLGSVLTMDAKLNVLYSAALPQVNFQRQDGFYTNLINTLSNNDFSISTASTSASIWLATVATQIVNIGAVSGNLDGSTLAVTSSTGGSNALINMGGVLDIRSTVASTTTSTGALICAGGVGIIKDLNVGGALSKGSGTFDIKHPVPSKASEGYRLRHSFVESPNRGDNIYRYTIDITDCKKIIELPDYFEFLNDNVQVFVNPTSHLGIGYGIYSDGTITVHTDSCGEYNILIVGTRKDQAAISGWDSLGLEYKQ